MIGHLWGLLLRVGGTGGVHTESSVGGVRGEGGIGPHLGVETRTSKESQII